MSLFCPCPDYEPEIRKINAPFLLQYVRSGGKTQYTGKPIAYCPWCGRKLVEEVAAQSGCAKCGTPTFGRLCGRCSGERC